LRMSFHMRRSIGTVKISASMPIVHLAMSANGVSCNTNVAISTDNAIENCQ